MGLPTPCFLCSFKTYPGTAGTDGVALAEELAAAANDADAAVAVAPQTPDLRLVARETSLPVVAQAADAAEPGEGTGDVLVGTLAAAGADAVFVNHPEREASLAAVRRLVDDCAAADLDSVVCVRNVREGRAATAFGADWLLFERPEDVASSDSLVERDPERVASFVEAVREVNPDVRVAVGGGIDSPDDVAAARAAGVDGVGAASAVVTATDPGKKLRDLLAEL